MKRWSPRRGSVDLSEQVHHLLWEAAATVATAESLTGGRLAASLTAVPGASEAFRGGVVVYATDLKVSVLGVPEELVDTVGVVSSQCAGAMAEGVRRLTGATYGIATTGVAGPTSQEGKPVGTVFVAIRGPRASSTVSLELSGDREQIVSQTCTQALLALIDVIGADLTPEDSPLR